MSTRSDYHIVLNEFVLSACSEKTFINDATHVWNAAPINIKQCNTITATKKAIKSFVATLPI